MKRYSAFATALFVLLPVLWARTILARDLGPHGNLALPGGNGCSVCHLSDRPAGFEFGTARLEIPVGGKTRLADPVARFCWLCHRSGNPFNAPAIEARAMSAAGHGVIPARATVPDSWAVGTPVGDPFQQSGIAKTGMGYITCTTCHDVHDRKAPLYLRRSTPAGDFTALCGGCHPGRENGGFTGSRNMWVRDRLPYSTHPAAGAAPPAGKGMQEGVVCRDCHDVHHTPAPGEAPAAGLLRIAAGGSASDLCRRCHDLPTPGTGASHPMESDAGGRLPADAFASAAGVPPEWTRERHFDGGATPFLAGKEAPHCTSCHDLHGGMPGTSLLYGPAPAAGAGEGWCFSCHARDALARLGHPRAGDPESGCDCVSCHGNVRQGGASRWEAHRDFRARHAAGPGAAGGKCSGAVAPGTTSDPAPALVAALQDREPAVREQAAAVLLKLESGLDPVALLPASRDQRPDVRAQAARVIGVLEKKQGVEILLPLLSDEEARVRAAAVEALARIGDLQCAGAVLSLLQDPAPEVKMSAMATLGTLREPRAIPLLLDLLRGQDKRLRARALDALVSMNDARVLERMIAAPAGNAQIAWGFVRVLEHLDDPAASDAIATLLEHEYRLVRMAAIRALNRYPGSTVSLEIARALRDRDSGVASEAAFVLARRADPVTAPALAVALKDKDTTSGVKSTAALGLSRMAVPAAVDALIDALAETDSRVREPVNTALQRLTCRNFGVDHVRWREWWRAQAADFPLGRCR